MDLQSGLSAFPFLTADEFRRACEAFVARVSALGGPEGLGWSSVACSSTELRPQNVDLPGAETVMDDLSMLTRSESVQPGQSILRISKCTSHPQKEGSTDNAQQLLAVIESDEAEEDLFEDEDHETLTRSSDNNSQRDLTIDYDIVLSPTYQVPVLYFVFPRVPHVDTTGLDAIYQYLVPQPYASPLKSSGVMGGISFGYHPQSGIPAYFVHPCNTASAMRDIIGDRHISPEQYLLMWLSLVGSSINLYVPSHVFADGIANR